MLGDQLELSITFLLYLHEHQWMKEVSLQESTSWLIVQLVQVALKLIQELLLTLMILATLSLTKPMHNLWI